MVSHSNGDLGFSVTCWPKMTIENGFPGTNSSRRCETQLLSSGFVGTSSNNYIVAEYFIIIPRFQSSVSLIPSKTSVDVLQAQ